MPTYVYLCEGCAHKFEVIQRMSEDALTRCPQCKQRKLERVITGGIFCYALGEPKTLEQQADRNTKRFGFAECEEREGKAQERTLKAKGKKAKPKAETPWWRDGTIPGLIKKDKPLSDVECKKYETDLSKMEADAA